MRRIRVGPRRPAGDYDIGKGRPPLHSRFRPGQCGNSRGRPKNAKGTATMAREALEHSLPVIVNGKKQKMSVRAVAYRKLGDKAASGDGKALMMLLTLAKELPPPEPEGTEPSYSPEHDGEIIADFLKRHKEDGRE